jgi:hypothetical protein
MATKKDTIAAVFYQGYINNAKGDDVLKALKKSTKGFNKFIDKIPKKKINFSYAKGKWTIKELLQHIIDAERVFTYRALRFARKDATPLQSFDENKWTANANINNRKWNDLINEFNAVRKSTEILFASFNDDQLLSTGTASDNTINVLALGFICAGHVEHHINIIKERYL